MAGEGVVVNGDPLDGVAADTVSGGRASGSVDEVGSSGSGRCSEGAAQQLRSQSHWTPVKERLGRAL